MLEMEIRGGIGTLAMEFKPLDRVQICIQQNALGELLKCLVGDIATTDRGIVIPSEKLLKFIKDYRGGCPMLLGIYVSFDATTGLPPDSVIPITYEASDVVEVQLSLTTSLQHSLIGYVMSTYGGNDNSGLGLDFKCFIDEDECISP